MNEHWERFADELPWVVKGRTQSVGRLSSPGSFRLSAELASRFPSLSTLLRAAHATPVTLDADEFTLFSWESEQGISSWLSPRVPSSVPPGLLPDHAALLCEFGGITERGGELGDSWLLNTSESLTVREASHDASFLEAYDWMFSKVPGGIPIDLAAHYAISREANGNRTICHRQSGDVVLFASDHSFDHVTELEGCPPYSLYRLNGAPTFTAWVETVAKQWLGRTRA